MPPTKSSFGGTAKRTPSAPKGQWDPGLVGLLPVRGHPKRAAGRVGEQGSRAEKSNVSAKLVGATGTAAPPQKRATAQTEMPFDALERHWLQGPLAICWAAPGSSASACHSLESWAMKRGFAPNSLRLPTDAFCKQAHACPEAHFLGSIAKPNPWNSLANSPDAAFSSPTPAIPKSTKGNGVQGPRVLLKGEAHNP